MKKLFFFCFFITILSCNQKSKSTISDPYQPKEYVNLMHPEWSKNASIYQLNTRQFSEEGTFKAAQTQLPRLKDLGVDIIWFMPIHAIGEKNRKGNLGSPYAVKDYYSVNPEFGTLQDLKDFVNEAHKLGIYVILDWVANHTAWDHPWITSHPEWYTQNSSGQIIIPPGTNINTQEG